MAKVGVHRVLGRQRRYAQRRLDLSGWGGYGAGRRYQC